MCQQSHYFWKTRNVVEFTNISNEMELTNILNEILHLQHRKVWVWFELRLIFCFADMCKKSLSPERDIKFTGHVSWVGKTSMEAKMQMFQVCKHLKMTPLFQYNPLVLVKGKLIHLCVRRQVCSSPLLEKLLKVQVTQMVNY